jgi:hypothetical protein
VTIPAYALEPLERFNEYAHSATDFFGVCMRSIESMQSMPRLIKVVGKLHKKSNPEWEDPEHDGLLAAADKDAEIAAKECAAGFPLLQEFTLVGFWGAFEAAIEDLVLGIISNEPTFLRAEPFSKVKIPLAEFEALTKDDRMRLLLRELQRLLRSDQRGGVNSFEMILDSVNLSGVVAEEIKKAIWEMHHVRNLIVHRGSCVDRTFAESCPELGLKVGDRMKASRRQVAHYVASLLEYGVLIEERLAARYPADERASS